MYLKKSFTVRKPFDWYKTNKNEIIDDGEIEEKDWKEKIEENSDNKTEKIFNSTVKRADRTKASVYSQTENLTKAIKLLGMYFL